MYPTQWTGQGRSTVWSMHSPDLNSTEFYLWRHLNIQFYVRPVNTIAAFLQRQLSEYPQHTMQFQTCSVVHNKLYFVCAV